MDARFRWSFALRPAVLAAAAISSGTILAADPQYLDQGWCADERDDFYFTSQGSQLVPYEWFLALEKPNNDRPFRDAAHLEQFGFILPGISTKNPDSLPIGFVADDNPKFVLDFTRALLGEDAELENYPRHNRWVSLTCAACHTTQLEYDGHSLIVDGGQALADVETFLTTLSASLNATVNDDAKLTRFAQKIVVPGGAGASGADAAVNKEALRKEVAALASVFAAMVKRDSAPTKYGFGRLDAFGAIFNEVCATSLGIAENARPADAPASFPCLWDTPQLDWVQWNGSANNPTRRNVGEVLGVFGHYTLTAANPADQFKSTVHLPNLLRLERQIGKLKAPEWPADVFGALDEQKANRGAALYKKTCQMCHGLRSVTGQFPLTDVNPLGHQFIKIFMVPLREIKTDSRLALNFVRPGTTPGDLEMFKSGRLAPYLPPPLTGQPLAPRFVLLRVAVDGVIKRQVDETLRPGTVLTEEQQRAIDGFHDEKKPPNLLAYKARPLNGVWATAPYLHNGSVANLYQLLLPAQDRLKSFYTGSRKFDPQQVGFSTEPFDGGYEFHTVDADGAPLKGNSNAGHEGKHYTQIEDENGNLRDFTDEERWELVEFMKTLH